MFGENMKKSLIEKKIKEISNYLTSTEALSALKVLREELKTYEDPAVSGTDKMSSDEMQVSKEVASKSHAFALYTDGACRGNPGPGSYAFLVQKWNNEIFMKDIGQL